MKTEEEGSLTIFSALSLLLILSFLLALLEGARVSGLQMMDTLAADTGMDCVAAEYQTVLWDKYHLLYLDGAYGWDQFDENKVSSRLEICLKPGKTVCFEQSCAKLPCWNICLQRIMMVQVCCVRHLHI